MPKVVAVAVREFLATVRTRAFVLSVVMMPALMVAAIFGTSWVHKFSEQEQVPLRTLAVCDPTGLVAPAFSAQIDQFNQERPTQKFAVQQVDADACNPDILAQRTTTEELYGYVIFSENVLSLDGDPIVVARSDNQLETGKRLESMINRAVFAVRLQQADIDAALVAQLRTPATFTKLDLATGQPVSGNEIARALTPFAFMFLLFMGTFGIAQGLLTTVIEEKSSRVVEVLLSAVSPTQLMAGKIVGMVFVGFVLIAVWGSVGALSAQRYNLTDIVNGYRLFLAVMYFVPGFLLLAALMAGIGSACNELKEAQSMIFPVTLITVVPMMFWFYLSEHPASAVSIALSFVPPITPFVMILRVCADPDTPIWQIVSTLGVLWLSVLVAIWAAGKVFRVGVLMYGKPPSLRELIRWLRYS